MKNKTTIRDLWMQENAARESILDDKRACAALVKPWLLPPDYQQADQSLPDNYQSLGSRGITHLAGRMLQGLYPAGFPWVRIEPAAPIKHNPEISPDFVQAFSDQLYLWEMILAGVLEASGAGTPERVPQGFRTAKRMAIEQFLVIGDALERMEDDFRLSVFRFDQYVTARDSAGRVLHHIVRERIDPLTLPEDQQAKLSGLDGRKLDQDTPVGERMVDIYTRCAWQPLAKKWLLEQEIEGTTIVRSDESVSPFISTPFELVPGENYGRSFVEQNKGDIRSLDQLSERLLDWAALASKHLVATDYASEVRPEDLARPTGSIIKARVQGGQVQDVAVVQAVNMANYQVVADSVSRLMSSLGKAMLIDSESVRDSERTTAFEVQATTIRELEGALGGMYAPIADRQQIPTVQRALYQLRARGVLPAVEQKWYDIVPVTGVAALSRQTRAAEVMDFVQTVAQMGPDALRFINVDVLVNVMRRYKGIDEPGIVKSKQQIAQENAAAMQQQFAMQAAQTAVETAGAVAEKRATAGAA